MTPQLLWERRPCIHCHVTVGQTAHRSHQEMQQLDSLTDESSSSYRVKLLSPGQTKYDVPRGNTIKTVPIDTPVFPRAANPSPPPAGYRGNIPITASVQNSQQVWKCVPLGEVCN